MSEFTNTCENRTSFRWQLLATVSAFALVGYAFNIGRVRAADSDSDRPPVWIELGGQLSRLDDAQEAFAPSLMAGRPPMFSSSSPLEKLSLYSIDETGKILFEPSGSNWVFSAAVRYGRSDSNKHVRQQTHPASPSLVLPSTTLLFQPVAEKFANTNAQNSERHFVLDFQAGKDVGLGMFGKEESSVFNLGVRFAQFSTKSNIALQSDPDFHFEYKYFAGFKIPLYQVYHSNAANMTATQSFHGIGPSLSWDASAPFAGDPKDGELTFDWGVKAAILFGRQRANVHYQTTARYNSGHGGTGINVCFEACRLTIHHAAIDHPRVRTVTVPNIGGFAGLSFRYSNAKVSLGYRGDFFFGAMDGGIDMAKKEYVGFYGPFATISVGMGG